MRDASSLCEGSSFMTTSSFLTFDELTSTGTDGIIQHWHGPPAPDIVVDV